MKKVQHLRITSKIFGVFKLLYHILVYNIMNIPGIVKKNKNFIMYLALLIVLTRGITFFTPYVPCSETKMYKYKTIEGMRTEFNSEPFAPTSLISKTRNKRKEQFSNLETLDMVGVRGNYVSDFNRAETGDVIYSPETNITPQVSDYDSGMNFFKGIECRSDCKSQYSCSGGQLCLGPEHIKVLDKRAGNSETGKRF